MSQENLEIARRLYPGPVDLAARLGDAAWRESVAPFLHPDFETVGSALPMADAGVHGPQSASTRSTHGIDGFVDLWRGFLSAWQTWVVTPAEFVDVDDDRVLVLLDIRARSRTHQVEIPIDAANLLTLREGKVVRLELHNTRAEGLEAAGLRGIAP